MQSGTIASLDTDKAFYERMTWTQEGDALAALKGHDDRGWRERLYTVVGFTGVGQSGDPKKVSYDPASDASFPKNMSVSGNRAPQFTETRDALMFGIANLTKIERPAAGRNGGAGANPASDAQAPPAARHDACRRHQHRSSEPGHLALQGFAPAVAAAGAGAPGSQFQLRDDVPAGRQEAGAAGRRRVAHGERHRPRPMGDRHEQRSVRAAGQSRRHPAAGRLRHRHEDRQEDRDQEGPALG